MNRVFLSDSKFKNLFVFEAPTSSVKFGDASESRADTMVEIDTDSGKITSQYKMDTPGIFLLLLINTSFIYHLKQVAIVFLICSTWKYGTRPKESY